MRLSVVRPSAAAVTPGARALDAEAFAARLDAFGPFERSPRVAVAVSGGRDSMALVLLADEWARARGGSCVALTVDHGLRTNAAQEAATVAARVRARAIDHVTLRLPGPPPATGIEAWARCERYRALEAWCRENAVLHLLLAHHREDQGETWLMRTARGTGPAGAAGMAAVREMRHVRLLRPMLDVPRDRLTATARARGLEWVDDPMNRDPAFDRAALRLSAAGPDGDYAFGAEAARATAAGEVRADEDRALAELAARAVTVHPAGFVLIDRASWRAAPGDRQNALLSRCLSAVAGAPYPPRRERNARLARHLAQCDASGPSFSPRTLAGCRIAALDGGRGVLICREAAALPPPVPLGDESCLWDGRFCARAPGPAKGLALGALGRDGLRAARDIWGEAALAAVPGTVRPVLPALFRGEELVAVPDLCLGLEAARGVEIRFSPPVPVAGAPFGNLRLFVNR